MAGTLLKRRLLITLILFIAGVVAGAALLYPWHPSPRREPIQREIDRPFPSSTITKPVAEQAQKPTPTNVAPQHNNRAPHTPLPAVHWVPYTSKPGNFTVMLPGTPTTSEMSTNTKAGKLTQHQVALAQGDQGISYMIQYTDLPAGGEQPGKDSSALLKGMRDETLHNLSVELVDSQPITVASHQGLKFRFRRAGENPQVVQFFLVKQRMYYLCAGPESDNDAKDAIDTFLYSFKLL